MKDFGYRFKKNTYLLSSLGICASCGSNNIVNKNDQDDVKSPGSTTGHERDSGNNSVVPLGKNDISIEEDRVEEKVKNLNRIEEFRSKRVKSLHARGIFNLNMSDSENLYSSEEDHFVFKIISKDEVSLIVFDVEEVFKTGNIEVPEKVCIEGKIYWVTCIDKWAFVWITSLESIKIPKTVTKIGMGAFECCKNLGSIQLPEGLTEIEDDTFGGCRNLTEIKIPQSITVIGEGAFRDSGIKEIVIPASVRTVKWSAFDTSSIEKIILTEGCIVTFDMVKKACGERCNDVYTTISVLRLKKA